MSEDRESILNRIRRVILWLVISVIFDVLGFISTSGSGWSSNQITMHSIAEISSSAIFGVLFFLGAALLLSSRFTRFKEESDNRELVKSFIIFLFLTTMYLFCKSVIAFNTFVRFGEDGASVGVAYFYGAVLAAAAISFIYCSLAAGLAIVVDDWRLTVAIGCGLFLVTNLFIGMPFVSATYYDIPLFSPTHFYRVVLLIFSGFFMALPYSIQVWGGLSSIYHVIIPLLVYVILTGFSIWAFRKFGAENIQRTKLLVKSDTIQVTEQEQVRDTTLRRRLKARRKAVLMCFLVFGLLIPVVGYSSWSDRDTRQLTVIYQRELSPTNGELFYGAFITEVAPPDVSRYMQFPLDILDWGQCPSYITFEYTFGEGSINDFLELDEQDRWRSSRTIDLVPSQTQYCYSHASGLDEHAGVHYWAFRFYSNAWTEEQGALRIGISVVLIDSPDF